jgi:hypothetical protein
MGREVRKVPPNWEHPKDESGRYDPLLDEYYPKAAKNWLDSCIAWENGTHPDLLGHDDRKELYPYYWEWDQPPNEEYCRPYPDEQATWFQLYETVSEGTPTTPPFETKAELVEYLVKHGEYHDPRGWSRESAEYIVKTGWGPSMIIHNGVVTKTREKTGKE